MAQMTDTLEVELLNYVFSGTALPTIAIGPGCMLDLCTSASIPTDSVLGTEVVDGGYARQTIVFAAAASPGGTKANSAAITFGPFVGGPYTIRYVEIWSPNLVRLMFGQLTTDRTVNGGDTLVFNIGDLVVQFS